MRRSIVQMAVIVVLASAGSAGGATPSPQIICPGQQAHIVPPCCPLPPKPQIEPAQPICCTSVQCCQTTCCPPTTCLPVPTITSSPNPSRAGQKVGISGNGAPGAQVLLWRKLAGQSSFHQVNTTTADSSGKYTFTMKRGTVMADQEWYVTSSGGQSSTLAQQVDALVALTASNRTPAAGQKVVLRGHVTPSHAGQAVLVEVSRGGAWHVIARPRLGRGSGYSVTHRFARSGAVKVRAVLPRDSRNDRSTSPTLTLTVKS